MVFSFQVADALLTSGAAKCILVIGAEAHAGFMPWVDWDILEQDTGRKPAAVDFERATEQPAETIAIRYDSHANLVAMGVIRDRRRPPRPFPGFVPDPIGALPGVAPSPGA